MRSFVRERQIPLQMKYMCFHSSAVMPIETCFCFALLWFCNAGDQSLGLEDPRQALCQNYAPGSSCVVV